jgi:thiopeptide-type bacteriocin biosynthesis protein
VVRPLVGQLVQEQLIDKWFFVRYGDPRFHLRLRFHGCDDHVPRIMQLVGGACAPVVANGRVARLLFDTYLPEIERYGGAAALAIAESMFHADSDAALDIVSRNTDGDASESGNRELVALAGIDRYFADAGLYRSKRIELLDRYANTPARIRRERSAQFRARRAGIARIIAEGRGNVRASWLWEILARRSESAVVLFADLRNLEQRGEIGEPVDEILFSITHMWVNRAMTGGWNLEPMFYDFLHRHYRSEEAQSRAGAR